MHDMIAGDCMYFLVWIVILDIDAIARKKRVVVNIFTDEIVIDYGQIARM